MEFLNIIYDSLFGEAYRMYIFSLTSDTLTYSQIYLILVLLLGSITLICFYKRNMEIYYLFIPTLITLSLMYYFGIKPLIISTKIRNLEVISKKIMEEFDRRELNKLPNVFSIKDLNIPNFSKDEYELSDKYISFEFLSGKNKIENPYIRLKINFPDFGRPIVGYNIDKRFRLEGS